MVGGRYVLELRSLPVFCMVFLKLENSKCCLGADEVTGLTVAGVAAIPISD